MTMHAYTSKECILNYNAWRHAAIDEQDFNTITNFFICFSGGKETCKDIPKLYLVLYN